MRFGLDPALVEEIRALRQKGRGTAEILRFLAALDVDQADMRAYFQEAFGLDSYAVAPIGGWFADGSGELDDEAVSRLVDAAIDAQSPSNR